MPELRFFASDTKRELLRLMKRRGTVSLDDLIEVTGLTRTTLREHLGQLERDGLVSRSTRKQGRGRPSLRYNLTHEGERLFPTRDSALLGRLIEYLQREGRESLLQSFFEAFWEERLDEVLRRFDRLESGDRAGRADVLAAFLQEQGFMPEIRIDDGAIVIRECNCPFPETVRHTRIPCRLEEAFFQRLFGERIERVTYIPDGSPACTYAFADPVTQGG